MRIHSGFLATILVALPLGFLVGCSGSSDTGTMRVTLVDGPINGFQEVNLNIQSVEIKGNGGWITLASPNKTVNLLGLVGGVAEVLADGTTLPEGRYGQMRLVLGSGNTVKLANGTVAPLTVPSGLQTGVKLIVNFEVAAGTTKDVWIDFDAAHSIQLHGAGASGQYILRPTVWAYDKIVTGSISGTMTDGSGAPLEGALVMAEVLDGGGKPVIARTVPTAADGSYTLNLLPVGYTYFVVSQPVLGTTYEAKASQGFALSGATPTFTYSASFATVANPGSVTGTFAVAASTEQHDVVDLLQTFATGTFVTRSTIATTLDGVESYTFANVPGMSYTARATRVTTATDGSTVSTTTSAPSFVVNPGAATTVNF